MSSVELLAQLSRFIASPPAATQKKVESSISKATNALSVLLSLEDAQRLGNSGVKALTAQFGAMGGPDLKKILKRWDPARKISKDATVSEMREIATSLLVAEILPMPKVTTTRRGRAAP